MASVTPSPPNHPRSAAAHSRARYSIGKFAAYSAYCRTASPLRQTLVIVLTPLAPLVVSLVLQLIPLQPPELGLRDNLRGIFVLLVLVMWLTYFGASVHYRAVARISHDEYSTARIALAAAIGALHMAAFAAIVSSVWRFPIPFFFVLLYVPWLCSFVWSHFVATRGRLFRSKPLLRNASVCFLCLVVQVSQIVVYPALSAAYAKSNDWQRLALTMLFPLIKHLLKKMQRRFAHGLGDYTEELVSSGIEICASMYQSTIMQSTLSTSATAFVIGIDLIHGLTSVAAMFMRRSVVPQREIVSTAAKFLQSKASSGTVDTDLVDFASPRIGVLSAITWLGNKATPLKAPQQSTVAVAPAMSCRIAAAKRERVVLTHALEIMQAAESLLVVEYLEVVIPAVNGVFVVCATQLPNAVYNEKLSGFYFDPQTLPPALANLALYTVLQVLSLFCLAAVLRVRLRVAPMSLLAFHLETYAWSLQGKMVAWLPYMLQFSVVHFGSDFTFQFRFQVPTPDG